MAGTNEMGSVEGQLVGLPLAGPETFSQQQLAYLKQAMGLRETVLWEGNAVLNTKVQLSESVTNFEYVYIEGNTNDGEHERLIGYSSTYVLRKTNPISSMVITMLSFAPGWGWKLAQVTMTATTAQLTASKEKAFNSTGKPVDLSTMPITRIVGINRIAGGN